MVFPVVMYGCEIWTIKKAECRRIDAVELRCWRRLLSVPWTARRSNQSILKEISPEYSLEGLMLKLKLQSFGHLMWRWLHWKRPWCWERLKAGGEGDDRGQDGWMASPSQWTWFWAILGDGEGQGSLACCSPWSRKESDMTEHNCNKKTIHTSFWWECRKLECILCWWKRMHLENASTLEKYASTFFKR